MVANQARDGRGLLREQVRLERYLSKVSHSSNSQILKIKDRRSISLLYRIGSYVGRRT
jgi:hypothetical protein